MCKPTKKNNNFNDVVVDKLSKSFGLTKHFIRMCLRGDRTSQTADTIVKEYKRLVKQVEKALNQ